MHTAFYSRFVLILIFEILTNDDPHLQTVPQQIGVKKTDRWFVIVASVYFLEFLKLIL
jgi:hypothetical protein